MVGAGCLQWIRRVQVGGIKKAGFHLGQRDWLSDVHRFWIVVCQSCKHLLRSFDIRVIRVRGCSTLYSFRGTGPANSILQLFHLDIIGNETGTKSRHGLRSTVPGLVLGQAS